jgi:hypothetical protein
MSDSIDINSRASNSILLRALTAFAGCVTELGWDIVAIGFDGCWVRLEEARKFSRCLHKF